MSDAFVGFKEFFIGAVIIGAVIGVAVGAIIVIVSWVLGG
jgi:hypothetical protein